MIFWIPIFAQFSNILQALGQEKEVAEYARDYACLYLVAMWFIGLISIDRILLINLGKSNYAMYCQVLQPIIHWPICKYLTVTLDYGVIGAGLSGVISNFIILMIQTLLMIRIKECDIIMTVRPNDPRNFQNLKSFFELAIPSILIIFIEGVAYNTQVIIGGTISPEDQVFVVLVFNIALNSFAIPFGLSTAITSLMG